ncbi:hypothetical protein [Sphingobium sp. YR768]|uniref:hypothetical protein n=1 Tax=Sphingobium sp. YR768 TaxID=1884365 RepID=UPI0015A635AB
MIEAFPYLSVTLFAPGGLGLVTVSTFHHRNNHIISASSREGLSRTPFARMTTPHHLARRALALENCQQRPKIIGSYDPFQLKAGSISMRPNQMGFDPSDHRQLYQHAFAAIDGDFANAHETLVGDVGDVQRHLAQTAMLGDNGICDIVAQAATRIDHMVSTPKPGTRCSCFHHPIDIRR